MWAVCLNITPSVVGEMNGKSPSNLFKKISQPKIELWIITLDMLLIQTIWNKIRRKNKNEKKEEMKKKIIKKIKKK